MDSNRSLYERYFGSFKDTRKIPKKPCPKFAAEEERQARSCSAVTQGSRTGPPNRRGPKSCTRVPPILISPPGHRKHRAGPEERVHFPVETKPSDTMRCFLVAEVDSEEGKSSGIDKMVAEVDSEEGKSSGIDKMAAEVDSEEGKSSGIDKMVAEVGSEEGKSGFDKMVAEGYSEEEGPDHIFAAQASCFRDTWNELYSSFFGHFEDTTKIPNMRFTYKKPKGHEYPGPTATLHIFSVKIAKIWGGLQWPLHVFGMVAVRDVVDHNRNMIFHCPRESCQILTQEDPYLKLTGPTRAVLLVDPVTFEVDLQVKGSTQDEDQSLSFLAVTYNDFSPVWSRLDKMDYASKLSKVAFELGTIVTSVEATISLRVQPGLGSRSDDGFRARISARTASLGKAEFILLDSGDDTVRVSRDGSISLSRCVASVEVFGKLEVCVKAGRGEEIVVRKKSFKPRKDGVSHGILRLGLCTLDVTVAWSLPSISLVLE